MKLSQLFEVAATKPEFVYHCSSEQGLEELCPRTLDSYHSPDLEGKELTYVTSSAQYASGFSFPWTDEQVELGSFDNINFFIRIPKELKHLLYCGPVSLYEFKFNESMVAITGNTTPEFTTHKPIQVFKEYQYDSPFSCMVDRGLTVIIVNGDL